MNLTLLVIAVLGALAIIVSKVAKRLVPEIVVFLGLGLLIGPQGPFKLINERNIESLELLTSVAIGAIVFLIGDRLRLDDLRERRSVLAPVNAGQIVAAGVLAFLATRWAGADPRVAVVLGLIAAESGVLTISATVAEARARGPFTDLLMSSLGITNVVVALVFGLAFPFVLASTGEAATWVDTAIVFARLVVVSSLAGLLGGWILALVGRAIETSGELLLLLLIVLTGVVGAAVAVEGSVVISGLVAGLYVANAAPWLADRLFAAVRTVEAPIYLVFFIVAGAGIHLDELAQVGVVGLAYVVARTVGKAVGAGVGSLFNAEARHDRLGVRLGVALMPHAGMAVALAALVVEQAPQLGADVSAVVLGSIVVFELAGPLITRRMLHHSGEAGAGKGNGSVEIIPEVTARTFDKVLVPVGSLEVLLPRLPFLLDLIGTMRAELVAVHVSRPSLLSSARQEPRMLRVVRELAEERNIACTTVHRTAEQIGKVLLQVAAEEEVDLIIMGQPARTSLLEPSRWGVVAQRVVRDSPVPVLVYPVDPNHPERVPSVYVRRARKAETSDAAAGTVPAKEG